MPLYCLNCYNDYENPSAKCVICPEESISDTNHLGWCSKCFNQRLEKLKAELSRELQEKVHNLTNFMKRKGKPLAANAPKKARVLNSQSTTVSNPINVANGEEDLQILSKASGKHADWILAPSIQKSLNKTGPFLFRTFTNRRQLFRLLTTTTKSRADG